MVDRALRNALYETMLQPRSAMPVHACNIELSTPSLARHHLAVPGKTRQYQVQRKKVQQPFRRVRELWVNKNIAAVRSELLTAASSSVDSSRRLLSLPMRPSVRSAMTGRTDLSAAFYQNG